MRAILEKMNEVGMFGPPKDDDPRVVAKAERDGEIAKWSTLSPAQRRRRESEVLLASPLKDELIEVLEDVGFTVDRAGVNYDPNFKAGKYRLGSGLVIPVVLEWASGQVILMSNYVESPVPNPMSVRAMVGIPRHRGDRKSVV